MPPWQASILPICAQHMMHWVLGQTQSLQYVPHDPPELEDEELVLEDEEELVLDVEELDVVSSVVVPDESPEGDPVQPPIGPLLESPVGPPSGPDVGPSVDVSSAAPLVRVPSPESWSPPVGCPSLPGGWGPPNRSDWESSVAHPRVSAKANAVVSVR